MSSRRNGWIAIIGSSTTFAETITEESAFMRRVLARADGSADYWGDQVLCVNCVIDGGVYNYIYANYVHGVQYRIIWLTPSYYY